MQYVINSIINMDMEAENYEKQIKEEILKRKKTLNDELSNMESEYQGQIKFLKEQVLADSRKEAELKAQKIIEAKNSKLQQINERFQNNKAQIVNSVFQKIINS